MTMELMSFESLRYTGPRGMLSPSSMRLCEIEIRRVGSNPSIKAKVRLDDAEAEFLFARDIAGLIIYQPPMVSLGPSSHPAFGLNDGTLQVLIGWADRILPAAKPLGLDKNTDTVLHSGDPRRWESHSEESIRAAFLGTECVWTADKK